MCVRGIHTQSIQPHQFSDSLNQFKNRNESIHFLWGNGTSGGRGQPRPLPSEAQVVLSQ